MDELPELRGKRQKLDGFKGRTDDIAAQAAGFGNRQTYRDAKKIVESGTSEVIDAVGRGKLSVSAAVSLVDEENANQNEALKKSNNLERLTANRVKRNAKRAKKAKAKKEAERKPLSIPAPDDSIKLIHSDFRNLKIADESVGLIFTDPPYRP